MGVNHLTWFVEAAISGEDAMPRMREVARARALAAASPAVGASFAEGGGAETADGSDNPFSWSLCDLLGAFPSAMDRHVTEFFPHLFPRGRYYGKQLGIDAYSFEDTIACGDRIYAEMRSHAHDRAPLGSDYLTALEGEHEQVTEIIADLRSGRASVYSANLPNDGQVPGLPAGAIIESPCVVDGGRLRPIPQKPLTSAIAGTIATRLAWTETTVDAALEGSRAKFVQALLLDGSVDSLANAERLADELLAAQAAYLPQFARAACANRGA